MPSQTSGVEPKALESLIAISGEIPDFKFTKLLSAWRVTPQSARRFSHGEAERLDTLMANDTAGMGWLFHLHRLPLSDSQSDQHPRRPHPQNKKSHASSPERSHLRNPLSRP